MNIIIIYYGRCEVRMSGFLGGRGADGNQAHQDEPTRRGTIANVARGKALTFDARPNDAAVPRTGRQTASGGLISEW